MPAQESHMMPGNGRRSAPPAVLQSPPAISTRVLGCWCSSLLNA